MPLSPTAVVVGGASGIGLATAEHLIHLDAAVHVVSREQAHLDEAKARVPELNTHAADAGNRRHMDRVFAAIGPIDWLVVTVGGREGAGPAADLDLEMLRRALDAKLFCALTTVQAALPHLGATGSITLTGAITARAGISGTAGLAAVNGAVEALVRPLAVELAPLRVNAVSPGFVDTPWWDGLEKEAREAYFRQAEQILPARCIASADDVAATVTLAATNRNITGTVIECDAGARLVSLG